MMITRTQLAILLLLAVALAAAGFGIPLRTIAETSESTTYRLESHVIVPEGFSAGSTLYQMIWTTGESSASQLQGSTYNAEIGFPPTLQYGAVVEPTPVPEEKPTLLDRVETIIANTKEQAVRILPAPVTRTLSAVNKRIGKTVTQVRQDEGVVTAVDDVIEPITTTTVLLTTVGVAASASTLEVTNAVYLLFRFGYFWLLPLTIGKKRKPWGVVFDATTGRTIRGAAVRIFSKEFNKLRESQVTDEHGRFGFLVDVGDYYVNISHPGYLFPSRLLTSAMVSQYDHIYRGETLNIKERIEAAISINIPIDPQDTAISGTRIIWLRFLNFLGLILEKINLPLLIGGTLLSWITLIVQPKISNYVILTVYGSLIILRLALSKKVQPSWGLVVDGATHKAVELAVVRVYNMITGRIVATRITNRLGQFSALVPPGQYYLIVIKAGYHPFQSQAIIVTKQKGLIRLAVQITPLNIVGQQPPPREPETPGPVPLQPFSSGVTQEPPETPYG